MAEVKKALIIGGHGFIGSHLVKRLKNEGFYVKVVDLKEFPYGETPADRAYIMDIRNFHNEEGVDWNQFDRIYQVAADMGGAGFVFTGDNDADILTNSLSINLHVLQELKKANYQGKIFYSSSVCAYPDEVKGVESDAYPANPPSNYGWEKLTSERLYQAYSKNYGVNSRIARFHNCFGPYGTYDGGREKSPAAICRKVIKAEKEIEIWGNGEQLRPFIYIADLLDGIEALMQSDYKEPVNLGPSEGITINQMVDIVSEIAGKELTKKYIEGPTGGQTRNANNELAQKVLDWKPKWAFRDAIALTYLWIKEQIENENQIEDETR